MNGPAVQLEGIWFAYPGAESPALEGINLTVAGGTRLGILGPNGGGKSTLLKIVLGLLRPDRGRAEVFGLPPEEARRKGLIGYVPQKVEAELGFPMSVREVVMLGASWRTAPWRPVPAEARRRTGEVLRLTGIAELADRPIGTLSGGQMQRAMIARALAAAPKMLALDEPTVGIDAAGQQQFAALLHDIHATLGVTILIISHDLRAIAAGCDSVACLARRLHSHVSPEGLTPRVLAELFSHDLAGIAGLTGPVHVHAHSASECCEHDHPHAAHPPSSADLTISPGVSKREGGGRADP